MCGVCGALFRRDSLHVHRYTSLTFVYFDTLVKFRGSTTTPPFVLTTQTVGCDSLVVHRYTSLTFIYFDTLVKFWGSTTTPAPFVLTTRCDFGVRTHLPGPEFAKIHACFQTFAINGTPLPNMTDFSNPRSGHQTKPGFISHVRGITKVWKASGSVSPSKELIESWSLQSEERVREF